MWVVIYPAVVQFFCLHNNSSTFLPRDSPENNGDEWKPGIWTSFCVLFYQMSNYFGPSKQTSKMTSEILSCDNSTSSENMFQLCVNTKVEQQWQQRANGNMLRNKVFVVCPFIYITRAYLDRLRSGGWGLWGRGVGDARLLALNLNRSFL